MNFRCPTETLTRDHVAKLQALVRDRGEVEAARVCGLGRVALYKAAAGFAVSRLTAEVLRGKLDRI